MGAYWRDAIDRPYTADELADLVADATADFGSPDAIEHLEAETARLHAIDRLLREYLRKITNRVGAPTADLLADLARIEEVGEQVLARLERLRAVEKAARTYLDTVDHPDYAGSPYGFRDELRAALDGEG